MKRKRINPPYKVSAVRADGTRFPVEAHELVIELRPGIEVEIDLAPHPGFAGQLTLLTPPPAHMKRLYDEGKVDEFFTFFGGTNVLHVLVERRLSPRPAPRRPPSAAPAARVRPGAGARERKNAASSPARRPSTRTRASR